MNDIRGAPTITVIAPCRMDRRPLDSLTRKVLAMFEDHGVLMIPITRPAKLQGALHFLALLTATGFLDMNVKTDAAAEEEFLQFELTAAGRDAIAAPVMQ